jgi:uncharacterized protein YndB with AHSA1/START domain
MPETKNQVYRVVIKASIQDVWDALTAEGKPLPFFFGSVMHTNGIKPGNRICMRTPNGKFTGVVGEILEVDPPRRFSHTFRFTNLDDPPCKVTYELREVADGVEFTLTTDDVPAGTKTEKQMAQGGPFIVKTLKSLVETGKPHFGARVLLTIIKLTSPMTPKQCRSENWPLV